MTIIETARLSGLDPKAYLADVLGRTNDNKTNSLYELLPWNCKPLVAATENQMATQDVDVVIDVVKDVNKKIAK